ncbi:MAG: SUMF1/EgtB/PvdO family nonheme iron enzyme [Sodaliphilus sp.]
MLKRTVSLMLLLLVTMASMAQQKKEDVNGDRQVNLSDVTSLINHILSPTPSPISNQTFTVKGVTFRMIAVEGGSFSMGATSEQVADANNNEYPAHPVTLSSFYIGETEVTQALWEAVMGSNPSYNKGADLPVEQVSWDDCQTFIAKLNQLTGQNFSLPTEAQWEFAARGGNESKGYKFSGSNSLTEVGWYSDNVEGDNDPYFSRTHPVGTKQANELGIYDMSGNVTEWCSDIFSDTYYSKSVYWNPTGPSEGDARVVRDGSFWNFEKYCRVSRRSGGTPSNSTSILGLRLCLSPTDNVVISKQQADANEDGVANLSDVTHIINYILNYNPYTYQTFSANGVSFIMAEVKGGTFFMGSPSEGWGNERPVHQVTLDSYLIGQTEVTQELWKAVMGSDVPRDYIEGSNYPVHSVTWKECDQFINKLNLITGKNFRLPTEAEWEFAARGGNNSNGYNYSGSDNIDEVAWYSANSGGAYQPVATKAPNELGLYDMSGNVWEWCSDWYGSYSSSAQTNPTGPESGQCRVYRGGYCNSSASDCRVSCRDYSYPSGYGPGLRLCLTK